MKRFVFAGCMALLLWPCAASAHDVPDDVRIQMFLKPEGKRMVILVRIPANALIDILFPTRPESDWLDLQHIDGYAREGAKVWVADLLVVDEDGSPLPEPRVAAVRVSGKNSPAFRSYASAMAEVTGERLPPETLLSQDQAAVDTLLETPIRSARSDFSFEPRFARVGVRVTTTLAFLPAEGGIRQCEYEGDPEGFHLDPTWGQTLARLTGAGVAHYFDHVDYFLFLVCIAILFERFRTLAVFAGAFAAAQSAAMAGFILRLAPTDRWIPLWGVLIAAVTVYAGIEAIVGRGGGGSRWIFATVAGLLFGSGYCFALRPVIQYGGTHRIAAVLAFNTGILMSCFAALLLLFAGGKALARFSSAPKAALIIAAAIALHISWHRLLERARELSLAPMSLPMTSLATIAVTVIALGAFAGWAYRARRNAGAAR